MRQAVEWIENEGQYSCTKKKVIFKIKKIMCDSG